MKLIKLGIISIIVIVTLITIAIPVPTEIGEGFETIQATRESHKETMRNIALTTSMGGLVVLVTMAFIANDKFAKYTFGVTITILLFSVFSDVGVLMYMAIAIAVVFMIYDVVVNNAFEKEEELYEEKVKNTAIHKKSLSEKRKKLFKNDLSEMRTKKSSSHKERL